MSLFDISNYEKLERLDKAVDGLKKYVVNDALLPCQMMNHINMNKI